MLSLAKYVAISILALLGSGCSQNMQIIANASAYCQDWRVYKPQQGDKLSAKSAAELLASNEARHKSWGCAKLKNEAAG